MAAGWSFRKTNSAGNKVIRNRYKYGALGAGAGWLMLDPLAGEKVGNIVGQGVGNVADAGVNAVSPLFDTQISMSSSSSLAVILAVVVVMFVPKLMR